MQLKLVGMRFHSPAIEILKHLPAGTPLTLIRTPDNPFDANAIEVHIDSIDIPETITAAMYEAYGFSDSDVEETVAWMLGFIAKDQTHLVPKSCLKSELSFNVTGWPVVSI